VTRLIAVQPWPRFALAAANDVFSKVPNMIFSTQAAVPTAHGSRYLQQLCKHWAHNLAVEFTPEHGTVAFPRDVRGADYPGDALTTMEARETTLDVRIEASSPEQRDALKGVVARHLDHFAFREAPLAFDWRDS
jgi:uncharacterized protein